MTLLLEARGLQVGHHGRAILPPIDIALHPEQFWAVIGPNGSGKTTFLRTLLGLLPRLGGTIERGSGRAIGYVPQRTEIDPSVPARVVDLVRTGTERGWSFLDPLWHRRTRPQVDNALRDTEIEALARRPWTQLSEGQKQRVLMAQALAGEPDLLVLDEPTSAMDLHAERGIFELLGHLRQRRGLGVLVVSHNLGLLTRYASHVLFVDQDQRVVRSGPLADVASTPEFTLRYGPGFARMPGAAR
jgi:zinc transport system ATP-binding protein